MQSCYVVLALSKFLAVLLKFSQSGFCLHDGDLSLLIDEPLCGLLLLSQDFYQGRELDVDPR